MGKKVELYSYRFACEYCGQITPWQSKIGSSDLLKDHSSSQASQKYDLEEMFSSKPSRVPLAAYQQAFSEGKYYLLDANVRCPACKKVQYWSWKPNQSPKTIFDGLWLWGVLSIILLLGLSIPVTIAVLLLSITEISTLMLLYGLLPIGLGFALSVAVTIEANNIYHRNLHDFETVKAKNIPEIKWNEKAMSHTAFNSQNAINGRYSSKEPPPLWESLSVNQNVLDGNTLEGNESSVGEGISAPPSRTASPIPSSFHTEIVQPNTVAPPRPVPSSRPLSSEPIGRNTFQKEQKRKDTRESDRTVKKNISQRPPDNPTARDISFRENTQETTNKYLSGKDLTTRENTQEATEKRGIAARGAVARETALRGTADGKAVKVAGFQDMTTREVEKAAQASEKRRPGSADSSKVASLWEASEHKELTSFTETTSKRRKKIGFHKAPQSLENQSSSQTRETIPDKYQPSPWSSPQQDEVSLKKSSRMSPPDLPRGKAVSPSMSQSFSGRSTPDRTITDRPMPGRATTDRPMPDRTITDRPMPDRTITDRTLTSRPMPDRTMTNNPLTDRSALRTSPVSDSRIAGNSREAFIGKRHSREQSSEKLKEKSSQDMPHGTNRTSPMTSYDIELIEIGGDSFQVMKVVREITGLPFRETQNFVESVPRILVSGVSQATADSIKAKFKRLDAVVRIHPRH